MQKNKLSSAEIIYQGIKGLHKRNKSISSAYGLEIDMLSSAILGQIKGTPKISSKQIAKIFNLSPTQTSRVIEKLKNIKLLKIEKNIKDKRSYELCLSIKGHKVYEQILNRAVLSFESAYNRLENSEKPLFKDLFKKFLNSINTTNSVKLNNDPALMQEIRHLTRTIGLLSNNLFGIKGVEPITWHILSLIYEQSNVTAKLISLTFGLKLATAYAILTKLKKDALIKISDKSSSSLILSSHGKYFLNKISTAGLKIIEHGINNFSTHDKKLFAELWLKYSGELHLSNERVLGQEISLSRALSAPERFEFRKFIIEQRVKQNLIRLLPDKIGSNESELIIIKNKSKIIAACEAVVIKNQLEIIHFLCSQDFELNKSLLKIILEELFNIIESSSIAIRTTNCSHNVWALIPASNGSIKIVSKKAVRSFLN